MQFFLAFSAPSAYVTWISALKALYTLGILSRCAAGRRTLRSSISNPSITLVLVDQSVTVYQLMVVNAVGVPIFYIKNALRLLEQNLREVLIIKFGQLHVKFAPIRSIWRS